MEQASSSYGRDSNGILEQVMGVDKRPTEIKKRLTALYNAISLDKLEEARTLVQELREEIGKDEPELYHAELVLRRKEALLVAAH